MGVKLQLGAKVTDIRTVDEAARLRRRFPRRRGPHRQARLHPGRRGGEDPRCRRRCCARWKSEEQAAARPPRRRLRRRQHRARRGAHRQAPRRHRCDHRLSPHARSDAGARFRGRGGARGRRHDALAVDHQAHGRRACSPSRRWCSTTSGFPQPTGEFETLEADSLVLALGQDVDLSLLDDVPGLDGQGRRDRRRAEHDDRPCPASSRAATWCRPSAP